MNNMLEVCIKNKGYRMMKYFKERKEALGYVNSIIPDLIPYLTADIGISGTGIRVARDESNDPVIEVTFDPEFEKQARCAKTKANGLVTVTRIFGDYNAIDKEFGIENLEKRYSTVTLLQEAC